MKILFLLSGIVSLGIGVLGIVLPVLPTTPFLLLTGVLFAKSSDKYRDWFMSTRIYEKYLKEFQENKTMTKKNKWSLMIFTDVILLITFINVDIVILKVLIVLLAVMKHFYFYRFVKVI